MQPAGQLIGIEDVQRPAKIEGEEVGDVDQRRDRPQAGGEQQPLHPLRGLPVAQAADQPAGEVGAGGCRLGREVEMHPDRASEAPRDWRRIERQQGAEAGGGEIAGDAADGEAVAAVGGDGDVDDGIVEPHGGGGGRADDGVSRQLDDAGMLVGQGHLALRQQHPGAIDAPDLRRFQSDATAGDHRADRREHTLQPGAGVGRTAHDLEGAAADIDGAHLQLVSIGMRLRVSHLGDDKARQRRGAILDALDLQADHRQPRGDGGEVGIGVKVTAQPGQRELHRRYSPVTSDGCSSAAKP